VVALTAWVAGSALGALSGTVAARAQSSGVVVEKAHAGYTPSLGGSKPVVILAIGSGARPGENAMRSLGDSLHLIFLDPEKRRAVLVGVPRDSYVPIPGRGTGKINSSLVMGGPELLVQTMEQAFGVTIDYWALTTFWGFTAMIDAIGGL
jgi:anionic cell wall polymer biosynthesis LytR-Cps2A-Psr (LCP) family protein